MPTHKDLPNPAPVEDSRLKTTKQIAKIVTGLSASYVIHNIIKNNTTPQTKIQKIKIIVGGFVIGGVVVNATDKYVDNFIDQLVDLYHGVSDASAPKPEFVVIQTD